jgi:hypothetical protein
VPLFESTIRVFQKNIEIICESLWTPQGRSLAKLVSLGVFENGSSWKLFKDYKNWGVLHLLILSGSQFYSFIHAFEFLLRFIQRIFYKKSFPQLTKTILLIPAFVYLKTLNFSAPLLRCALLWVSHEFIRPYFKHTTYLLIFIFCLHILVIEKMNPSNSAFLSWFSFLILLFVKNFIQNPIVQNLLLSTLLQATLCVIKGLPFSALLFLRTMIANLVLLPLYEKIVFPFVGFATALALLLSFCFSEHVSYWISRVFIATPNALILDLILCPLLVAHRAFRYTF